MRVESCGGPATARAPGRYLAGAVLLFALACGGGGGGGGGAGGGGGGGGGGGTPDGHLRGVAASGLPIAGGVVAVVAADGSTLRGAVGADGAYDLDANGHPAPLLIEVVGAAGGQPAVLHSSATATDLTQGRPVNVTPLTELAVAYALGASPAAVFRDPARDLGALTDGALQGASGTVQAQLAPVLAAYGVSGDPRIIAFAADGSGLDAVLDALKLVPVQSATGAPQYELRLTAAAPGAPPVVLGVTRPGAGPVLTFSAADKAQADAAVGLLPAIDARLQALAGLFQVALPSAAAAKPYFTADFRQNGLDLEDWFDGVFLTDRWVGFKASAAAIDAVVSASEVWVTFQCSVAHEVPWRERFLMRLDGGVWKIAGNQAIADVGVSYLTRFKALPFTEAEVAAYPGVVVMHDVLVDGVSRDTCYYLPFRDGTPDTYAFLGCHGDASFATIPYLGTTDSPLLAHPDQALDQFLLFYVSALQVAAGVDHVVVTGPGLPAAGITLARSTELARDAFILKNDSWHWNAFNTARCGDFASPRGCALDWSAVTSGATYAFQFLDAAGQSLAAPVPVRLLGTPHDDAYWLARRDDFPLFLPDARNQFTTGNMHDASAGAPFTAGGTVMLPWRAPADPAMVMSSYWIDREHQDDDGLIEEHCGGGLYGLSSGTVTCAWHAPQAPTWVFADLYAQDPYGNQLSQEINPGNPY